jgi:hypothetical protein
VRLVKQAADEVRSLTPVLNSLVVEPRCFLSAGVRACMNRRAICPGTAIGRHIDRMSRPAATGRAG